MSLLVWLPLNGNLNNQGVDNATFSIYGADSYLTTDTSGKIGSCYKRTAQGGGCIRSSKTYTLDGDITMACWAYVTANPSGDTANGLISNHNHADSSSVSINVKQYSATDFRISCSTGYGTGRTYFSYYGTTNIKDSWHHLALTYSKSAKQLKLWVDGNVEYTLNNYNNSAAANYFDVFNWSTSIATSANYKSTCKLNDVRLYDNCLSPKEIKELAKGLVCHYPLNGGGRGGDNLLKNTADLTLWAKEGGITTTWDSEKNMYKIEDSTHTNSRWGIYQDINVEANTSYTITVTLDGTACGAGFAVYDSSTSFPPAVIGTTGRQSYTLTSGANSTKARVYLYTNCGVDNVAWFSLPKVEKSNHTTPWMPNSADTEYTAMGYNSTTEYDVSGYGYNGTKNGTFAYDIDTPRYSVCTKCSGSNYVSLTSPSSEIRTISFWGKWDSIPSGQSILFVDGESKTGFGLASNGIICSSNNITTYTFNKSVLVANTWYHFVIVCPNGGSNTSRKLYINGVEQTATSNQNYWSYSLNQLQIGKRSTSSDGLVGKMSDFRAYATALSDTQIAELYNTAVSVANNGTLMGYELVEV